MAGPSRSGPPSLSIRRASAADQESLEPLLSAFLGREYPASAEEAESLRFVLTSPAHIVLIAEDGGVPVGMITGSVRRVARYGFPIAEADEGFVTPDARSRGVGRALYTSLERAAREQGCGRVFLASNNNRSDVHEFFRHLGYRSYGTHFRMDLH